MELDIRMAGEFLLFLMGKKNLDVYSMALTIFKIFYSLRNLNFAISISVCYLLILFHLRYDIRYHSTTYQ